VNTSYDELREMCPETNLWIYLLIIIIIGVIGIFTKKSSNGESNEKSKIICQ